MYTATSNIVITMLLSFFSFSFLNAQNLVINGDFEDEVNLGFTSEYTIAPICQAPSSVLNMDFTPQQVYISRRVRAFDGIYGPEECDGHGNGFIEITVDHTHQDTSGRYLLVNSHQDLGEAPNAVWIQTVTGLTPGESYTFKFWYTNYIRNYTIALPIISAEIDDVQVMAPTTLGNDATPDDSWQEFVHTWTADADGSAKLEIVSHAQNLLAVHGEDFALDDILFAETALLPVEFLGVDAFQKGKNLINVVWETATEQNTDYFEIEFADAQGKMHSVAMVEASGNSSEIQRYDSEIILPYSMVNLENLYYRVKSVDYDAYEQYSQLGKLIINSVSLIEEIAIYPNPSNTGTVTLSISDVSDRELSAQIIDTKGTVVKTLEIREPNQELNIQELGSGLYSVLFYDASGPIHSEKLLIQL